MPNHYLTSSRKNKVHNYLDCFTKAEEAMGERYLYKEYFSVLTLPQNLYSKLLGKRKKSQREIDQVLSFYQERLKSFQKNLLIYEHKDIYHCTSITDLVKRQQIYLYDHTGISLVHLEKEEVIAILENIIHLLRTYRNYYVSIIRNDLITPNHQEQIYCLAKDRQSVIFEVFKPPLNSPMARLSIIEPMMVTAIIECFRQFWNQIAPVMKEKEEVIAWLQNEVNLLKSTFLS